MKFTKIAVPIVVVIVIALGVGVATWHNHPTKVDSSLTKVRVAMDWTPNTNHTGMYVAKAKGWYKSQGINLEILPYSANVSSSSLVLSGKADVGISTTEDIVAYNAKKQPLVALGAIVQHNTSGFIVRSDSGINSPKDLDGKVYGGYGSLSENAVVSEVIKKDGGTGDFKNVTLNVEAMQALESKKIDFVWAFEGWEVIEAKHDGVATKFFPITSYGIPDGPNLAYAATPGQIKQQPDILKRFMAATAQGYEYARRYPKESAQLLISTTSKATFPDPSLVFDSQTFLSSHYADNGRKWGVQDRKSWHDYPKFMLDAGVVADKSGKPVQTLKYDQLFTNQFVQ